MRVIPPPDCEKSGHHQLAVDTTTPTGRVRFQMMGVFVEFERTMIKERVMVGLRRFRAELEKEPGFSKPLACSASELERRSRYFTISLAIARSKIENPQPGRRPS
jgi:DNA invertase Pin-like site-specific DNA recombinase